MRSEGEGVCHKWPYLWQSICGKTAAAALSTGDSWILNVAPELADCARHAPVRAAAVLAFPAARRLDAVDATRRLTNLTHENEHGKAEHRYEETACTDCRSIRVAVGARGRARALVGANVVVPFVVAIEISVANPDANADEEQRQEVKRNDTRIRFFCHHTFRQLPNQNERKMRQPKQAAARWQVIAAFAKIIAEAPFGLWRQNFLAWAHKDLDRLLAADGLLDFEIDRSSHRYCGRLNGRLNIERRHYP